MPVIINCYYYYCYYYHFGYKFMKLHSKICAQIWHSIHFILRHLDLDSAKLLATTLVSSRLDYCNSLLYGIADIDLTRLQRVQSQLARLVTNSPPFTRSIPLLCSFHWLPVRFRILFKINLLTYKTLREKQPVYLHSMLAALIPSRSLRSNNDNSLSVPRVKTNTGARAFHSCAPSLWNNLPLSVRSASSVATFKKYLKTSLWFGLSPIDTVTPHSLLMLRNCFLDFAVVPLSLASPGILAL